MNIDEFLDLRSKVILAGFGWELAWSESIRPCKDPDTFLREYIWVVIHSGMKHEVARKIEGLVWEVIERTKDIENITASGLASNLRLVYRHNGKTAAIAWMIKNRISVFKEYLAADDKLAFLESLSWIGPITKYHLAKNLGLDLAKPDRHLARISEKDGRSCQQLCADLASQVGCRIATVDQVLWRASELGYIANDTNKAISKWMCYC